MTSDEIKSEISLLAVFRIFAIHFIVHRTGRDRTRNYAVIFAVFLLVLLSHASLPPTPPLPCLMCAIHIRARVSSYFFGASTCIRNSLLDDFTMVAYVPLNLKVIEIEIRIIYE